MKKFGSMELEISVNKDLAYKIDPLMIQKVELLITLPDGSVHTIKVNDVIDIHWEDQDDMNAKTNIA